MRLMRQQQGHGVGYNGHSVGLRGVLQRLQDTNEPHSRGMCQGLRTARPPANLARKQ